MVLALVSVAPALLLGGEWAGWACTYSSSGALQRVPESYLSKSSLEWGGAPAGFEELCSEALEAPFGPSVLSRRTARVLPDDGCACENMMCEISRDALMVAPAGEGDAAPLALDAPVAADGSVALETVFGGLGTEPRVARSALAESARRTRVSLVYDPAKRKLAAPVVVRQERRYDDALSLDVQEASGGRSGLDASWISCAVGINNFGEAKFEGAGGAALELPGGVEVELELGSYPTPDALEVRFTPTEGPKVAVRRTFSEGRVEVVTE